MIGVGTWDTEAEFKDVKVAAPDGTLLFHSDFSKGARDWRLLGDGAEWKVQDGVLRQTSQKDFIRALAGDKSWTDYTLTLKARKLSGEEGFLILFRLTGDQDRTWWNIGGWGNTQDGLEAGKTLDAKPGQIDTGRWYDVRVEVHGKNVKCFLDGRLVHDLDYRVDEPVKAFYATASRENQSGDVIVKIVNASAGPMTARVDLLSSTNLAGTGTATVLTSGSGTDENSLDDPRKVSPKTEALNFDGASITRAFPGNSFTVLRLQTK
jgi:alpha-L-arabinofuranosidase